MHSQLDSKLCIVCSCFSCPKPFTLCTFASLQLTYNQIALTEESNKYFTYSHDLTYPPYKPVRVLPRDHQHTYLSFPVLFKARVQDADSHQEIADVDFIPFAPLKCKSISVKL